MTARGINSHNLVHWAEHCNRRCNDWGVPAGHSGQGASQHTQAPAGRPRLLWPQRGGTTGVCVCRGGRALSGNTAVQCSAVSSSSISVVGDRAGGAATGGILQQWGSQL
jgi:hypothetical protein